MSEQAAITFRPRITIIRVMVFVAFLVAVIGSYRLLTYNRVPNLAFTSLSGEKITSESLRGKVVLVNFWATNCTSCIHDMPNMVETYKKFKEKGLEVVAVAMSYDAPNYVKDYTQTRQLPFKVAYDGQGQLAKAFGDVEGTPTTFVVDKNGHIILRYKGVPGPTALHHFLENALKA